MANDRVGAMPSLLYESKASFLKRLAEFYPNFTNDTNQLSLPIPAPQDSPMKAVQEFQVGFTVCA